jgi:cell division septation protein DedD
MMSESVSPAQDSWPEFVEEPIELSQPLESQDEADSHFALGLSPGDNVPFVTARLQKANSTLGDVLRESGALRGSNDRSLKEEFETLRRTAEVSEQPAVADEPDCDPPPINIKSPEPIETYSRPAADQPFQLSDASALEFGAEQWPVLLSNEEPPPSSSWKLFVAVGILLALGAGAGAAYYFFIRPKQDESGQAAAQKARVLPPGSNASQSGSRGTGAAQARPEDSGRPQATASPAQGVAASAPPSATSQADALQGKFSLQAASFPNAVGANEFAEKLHRAGVPAYVVSADIPGKGRWFRVRVGRFGTRDEATRFAGDARLRAKAAGLALQLVPCDYETPGK